MPYEVNSFVKLSELKTLTQRTASELAKVSTVADSAIKYISVSGNTISFWTDAEHTGTADFTADFPKELFLDQVNTKFVSNFTWSNELYPGSTNPNKAAVGTEGQPGYEPAVVFNGKPVFVLAVKGTTDPENGTASDTVSYSFIDVSTLVDTYSPASGDSAKVLTINGYTITFNVSAAANNAITVQNDGLHVDISNKTDKVNRLTAAQAQNPYDENDPEEATAYASFNSNYSLDGKIALLDTNGNLKDSGISVASAADVTAMLNEVYGEPDEDENDN